jgi:chromosome segregation ATPase
MEKVSVSLTPEHLEKIEERADEDETGRSAALRAILDECDEVRDEYEEVCNEYEAQIDDLRTEVERLKREKRLILEEREEKRELARFAETQKSILERREERELRKDRAGFLTKAKWALVGMDDDSEE